MKMTIEIRKENGLNAVSARELHEKLGIKTRFNDWIERMIAYGFESKKDYITVTQKRVTAQGNETEYTDYVISLDMAKEICMIQRSDTGRKFRQYFIECEKELNRNTEFCNVPRMSKEEIEAKSKEFRLGAYDRLHALANEYREKSDTFKQILDAYATRELAGEFLLPLPETEKTYSATEIGEMLGVSANRIGKIANRNGLKTDEYGKYFVDKSKFSTREVQVFRYNNKGVNRFKELLKSE